MVEFGNFFQKVSTTNIKIKNMSQNNYSKNFLCTDFKECTTTIKK